MPSHYIQVDVAILGRAESLLGIDLLAQPHNARLTVHKRKDQSPWWEILVWFAQINYNGGHLELGGRKMHTGMSFPSIQKGRRGGWQWRVPQIQVIFDCEMNWRGRFKKWKAAVVGTNFKSRRWQLVRANGAFWPRTRAKQNGGHK